MTLASHIQQHIQEHGAISFAEFMHRALYSPKLGYYSSALTKLGSHGDFTTAPELTPLFGQTIARACLPVLGSLLHPIIFEFGAGSGRLCVDLLLSLERLNTLPEAYWILEVSASLQARQRALVKQEIPHLASRIQWITTWPTASFQGIILANEVLDAMPVERFIHTAEDVFVNYIDVNTDGEWLDTYPSCTHAKLRSHIERVVPVHEGAYQSEVNLWLDDWFASCANMLSQGLMLVIDYGFPRHEYYHPDRFQGTLMCHYQHQAHPNPFMHVGEQDITAHVDFTHVAEAASHAGFHVAAFTNQASFLLGHGILELCANIQDDKARVLAQQAVKTLIQPHDMGELFKVIALTKNLDCALPGFQFHDKRASL